MKKKIFFIGVMSIGLGIFFWNNTVLLPKGLLPQYTNSTENTAKESSPQEKIFTEDEEKIFSYEIPQASEQKIFCDPRDPKTVLQWRNFLEADVVINGGYFDSKFWPTGFVQAENFSFGNPQNYPAFIGMTSDHEIEILEKNFWEEEKFSYAISSFPLLVKDGKSNFLTQTHKPARRTIIAQKKTLENGESGQKNFFIIFEGYPTLFEAAKILEEKNFSAALNLDGGASTGFSSVQKQIPSSFVPCVIAVFLKE